jgi:predicted phosphodiesterase
MSALKDSVEEKLRAARVIDPETAKPADLERLAAAMYERGFDVKIIGGKLITEKEPEGQTVRIPIDRGKEHIKLGVMSDPHLGSSYEQLTALKDFYHYASSEGVDKFLNLGDITDGTAKMHIGRLYELHVQGSDGQVAYASETYPRGEDGQETLVLGGNHDMSFHKDSGVNVVRQIGVYRPDIKYVGHTATYVELGPLKIYMSHPSGGKPYADSYRLQKIAEALPVGDPVDLLLVGHLHIYCKDQIHGITAFQVPCFQRQYPYLAAKGLHPAIGGIILDIAMTDAGAIGRIKEEYVRYQAVERPDYDAEVSAEVNRGWTPNTPSARTPE